MLLHVRYLLPADRTNPTRQTSPDRPLYLPLVSLQRDLTPTNLTPTNLTPTNLTPNFPTG